MEKILQTLCAAIDSGRLVKIIFAGKRKKSLEYRKITLRPVVIKGEYMMQAEFHYDKKVTHMNIPYYGALEFAERTIAEDFKQADILTETEDIQILASKPDKPRITRRPASRKSGELSHDRKKKYILEDGVACDFLTELGVMSPEGRVYKKHYSKFRQINRYLEIADSCFEYLPEEGRLRIIDFGCGKSYLTFALYHYLRLVKGRDVEIIGLDLKKDVIEFCSRTAQKLGYDNLKFLTGDIADYESDGADMVVTLHACDTATDYALINAVKWHSKVILSVPCCQHELFSQIKSDVDELMLKHGIIRDKFTELLTDALRGLKLEAAGYEVAMTEFTSLEHTAKNIMIKAVMPDRPDRLSMKKAEDEYKALRDFYHVKPTIDMLETGQDSSF
jgi:SAM-dependent methyltransferase